MLDCRGPSILVRSMSVASIVDRDGKRWQYHSRSDHHSKIACWGVVFDMMRQCPLLRHHAAGGTIGFGVNHEMRDFRQNKKKKLDLVICTPRSAPRRKKHASLTSMVESIGVVLDEDERAAMSELPDMRRAEVGSVLVALEAKACMTAHQRALPRFYDELNSSHQMVHGTSEQAIAAAFVMINAATKFVSSDRNKGVSIEPNWSVHAQPRDAELAIGTVRQLPRRSRASEAGYDALAITVVRCRNDGSPVELVAGPPSPEPGDIDHYETMISRLSHLYAVRFKDL